MFMKKYIILSLLCIGLGGCNSWLDVTSDQEVYEESMFEEIGRASCRERV